MTSLKSLLPEHLSYFIPKPHLDRPLSRPKVVCSPCQERALRGGVKCCSFWPFMPNFLLGEALENPKSRVAVESLLQRQDVVPLPLGVNVPRDYQAWFMGRVRGGDDNHCPYYLRSSGECSIWGSRPAECAVFFCSYDGSHTEEFWKDLGEKLNQLEYSLSALVMLELGYLWPEIREQLDLLGENLERADGVSDVKGRAWLHHQLSPIHFYRKSWDIFKSRRELWRVWLEGWFDSPQGLA